MHWFRAHILLALLISAAILFLIGSFAAIREPQEKTGSFPYPTWGEEDIPRVQSPAYISGALSQEIAQDSTQDAEDWPFAYSYIQPFGSGAPIPKTDSGSISADTRSSPPIETWLAGGGETSVPKANSFFQDAYSLIPRGLLSAAPQKQKDRTPEEHALYEYGNAVGANIGNFESAHKNTTETLKNFFPEEGGFAHGDPAAKNAVLALAGDYSRLGETIANMNSVPEAAQALHSALAESYEEVGKGLASLAETPAGGDIIKAILAYNSSAETFIKNFVALAEFFSARGIKFSGSDSGNVFSFSATGGL